MLNLNLSHPRPQLRFGSHSSNRFVSLASVLSMSLVAALVTTACGGSSTADNRFNDDRSLASSSATTSSASGDSTSAECRHDEKTLRCVKFIKNYDADTITFDIPGVHPLMGKKISVRVNGIDAPEIKGENECEKKSARIARNLIENALKRAKRIDLLNIDRDKYFRILADVQVDGTDLKQILFRNGLAYEYHGGTKKKVNWCAAAEGKARLPSAE